MLTGDFASRVFAACTDANRQAASDELKSIIFRAFREGTLYTTDWSSMRLVSLERPRKRVAESYAAAAGHKAARTAPPPAPPPKKPSARKGSIAARLGPAEDSRRAARAQRFEREQAAFEREQEQELDTAIASVGARARPPPMPADSVRRC